MIPIDAPAEICASVAVARLKGRSGVTNLGSRGGQLVLVQPLEPAARQAPGESTKSDWSRLPGNVAFSARTSAARLIAVIMRTNAYRWTVSGSVPVILSEFW